MGGEQMYKDYCKAVGGLISQPSWDALESDRRSAWNELGRKYEEKQRKTCKCDSCGHIHVCRRVSCYNFCKVCADHAASWAHHNLIDCGQEDEDE
jgi:hypothetical protein